MRKILILSCAIVVWLYTLMVGGWFGLYRFSGDHLWWLALANAFTPFLFAPLVVLLPAALIARRRSVWIALLLPLAIFAWLYGPLFLPARPGPPDTGVDLTVMSFNSWGGSRSRETPQVIVDNGRPDIVALQELTPRLAKLYLAEVGHLYPYHYFNVSYSTNGLGILSRYPLTRLPSQSLVGHYWQVQIVRVDIDNKPLIVYNIHPSSSNVVAYLRQNQPLETWVAYSFRARELFIKRLLADMETRSEPIIVLGDFNSTDRSDMYALLSARLTDAHRTVGWGFGHTFPAYAGRYGNIPIIPRQVRIDMVFYSAEFEGLRSWVGRSGGESDHLPIIAELMWKPE